MSLPIFARTDEGVEITTSWPDEMPATREFIEAADHRWLQRDGRTLSFTLTNGSAVYRIVSGNSYTGIYLLKRSA